MKQPELVIRNIIFYVVWFSFCTMFCLTALFFIWFLPFNAKFAYLSNWNRTTIFLAKHIVGIQYKVTGLKNIPTEGTYVVLAKHQSQWETIFLLLMFMPVSIILKQELLSIPGFGWGLRMLKPIPIDRSNPKQALKLIQTVGLKRLLEDKLPILIFPEGTRIPVGQVGTYARSGASLAIAANVPLLYVSLNAGYFWSSDTWLKRPGTIEVIISEPVWPEGKNAKEITSEAQAWIEANIKKPA